MADNTLNQPHDRICQTLSSPLVRRVACGLVIAFYASAAFLSQTRGFDQDEFVHVHLAWLIHKGLLPYRDYFDQYTPLYALCLAPVLHFFNVETNSADAVTFLYASRSLMWLNSGLILFLTYRLGALWRGRDVALLALVFLLCGEGYMNRVLDIRPDPLTLVLWLGYLITVVRAMEPDRTEQQATRLFAWGGFLLAGGFLTIQKLVFAFPGLVVGMGLYIFGQPAPAARRARLRQVSVQLIGFVIPLSLTALFFYRHGALAAFVRYNFLFYLGMRGFSSIPDLHQYAYGHPLLVLFGVPGLLSALVGVVRQSVGYQDAVIVPATLSLVVGLFLIPLPNYQYYLLFLPLLSLFAGSCFVSVANRLALDRDRLPIGQWLFESVAGICAVLGFIALMAVGAGSQWSPLVVLIYWLAATLAFIALLHQRARQLALVTFLLAMCAAPLRKIQHQLVSPDPTPQLAEMRYIVANTLPTESVLDGYQGSGVYRPHAYFYWFLAEAVRNALTPVDKQELLDRLRAGSIAPTLILFDHNLRNLSPGVTEFFEQAYEPVGVGFVWRRRADYH